MVIFGYGIQSLSNLEDLWYSLYLLMYKILTLVLQSETRRMYQTLIDEADEFLGFNIEDG